MPTGSCLHGPRCRRRALLLDANHFGSPALSVNGGRHRSGAQGRRYRSGRAERRLAPRLDRCPRNTAGRCTTGDGSLSSVFASGGSADGRVTIRQGAVVIVNGTLARGAATCQPGERAVGGGPAGFIAPPGCFLVFSSPDEDGVSWDIVMRCDGNTTAFTPQV